MMSFFFPKAIKYKSKIIFIFLSSKFIFFSEKKFSFVIEFKIDKARSELLLYSKIFIFSSFYIEDLLFDLNSFKF